MTITDTGIRVDLPLLDYSKRRNTVVKECYMMLYPDHVQYKVVGEHETLNDDSGIWEEMKSNWRYTRKRDSISDVNMYYCNKEGTWSVGIEYSGVSGTGNEWICEGPKQALAIYTTLTDYMIDR